MEKVQYSKLLAEIPPVDVVVTMGCNVECPALPCRYRMDWDLDDPTGKGDSEFERVIRMIEDKVKAMAEYFHAVLPAQRSPYDVTDER